MFRQSCWSFVFGAFLILTANVAAEQPGEREKLPPRAVARLGSLAFWHGEDIDTFALSGDGKRAATVGRPRYSKDAKGNYQRGKLDILLWDVSTGRPLQRIPAPDGGVWALEFSPDGKFLAIGGSEKVYLWDVAAGKEAQRFRLDADPFFLRFLADGKSLLMNLGNKEIVQWDLVKRTDRTLWDWKTTGYSLYLWNVDVAPDGSALALLLAKMPAPAKGGAQGKRELPHRVEVVDLATGKTLFATEGKDLSHCLAVSPAKKFVAFGNERLAFWDVATNKKVRELPSIPAYPLPSYVPQPITTNEPRAWQMPSWLLYSPDSKTLAAAYEQGHVSLWDAATGKKLGELLHETPVRPLRLFAFSKDANLLALGGGQVLRLIDATTGKEIAPWLGHRMQINNFRYAPDGARLITRSSIDYCAWDTKTWRLSSQISRKPHGQKRVIATAEEKNRLLASTQDGYQIEDQVTGKVHTRLATQDKKYEYGSFSYKGDIVALDHLMPDGSSLAATFFSVADGKELFQLELGTGSFPAFSPVSDTVHWFDQDGIYVEADARTGKTLRTIQFHPDQQGPSRFGNLVYSWDGKYIARQRFGDDFRPRDDEAIPFWDVAANRFAYKLKLPGLLSMDFSYDSRLLVHLVAGKEGIRVLELASGKERRPLLGGHDSLPTRLATSPVDYTVAAGLPGNTVLVWDLAVPGKKLGKPHFSDAELSALWRELAGDDALKAEEAIEMLIQVPAQSVGYLREHLKPIAPVDGKHLERLITGLASANFTAREKASAELAKIAAQVEPALRAVLKREGLPAEARQRLEKLLPSVMPPADAATLQGLRALEVLEKIGSKDARQVIAALAEGAAGARLTQEAVAAQKRLKKRN